MAVISYREAVAEGYRQEMRRDERVFLIGEDVVGGAATTGDRNTGGIFGTYPDYYPEFGDKRCIDTPISESAIVGTAVGAALKGLRPVAEIMFADFIGLCLDQIGNQAAKLRYMFGGQTSCPIVLRFNYGAGLSAAAQHSQSPYALVTHIPGLKVVVPSKPADVKGLIATAVRDDDPVLFFDHVALYPVKGEVPEEEYTIPFGEAALTREGDHCTIVALARMVHFAEKAADKLAEEGITCDVIDPRTISPLDEQTILESVQHTGRLVVVDEAPPRCSFSADVAALAAQKALRDLKAPVEMVTAPFTPVPFAPNLEREYVPSPAKIAEAVKRTLES